MNILITGANGFIGSHLVKSLPEHNVMKWNKDIENFYLDETINFVVHLAALTDVRQSVENPELYWTVNVEYSKRIFDACKNIPIVYASSSCAKEWWLSPYGTTKRTMEELAYNGHVGLRFTTVWGDGARNNMLMGRIKNETLKYKTNHIRDFIHVSDVVSAIKLFIDTGTKDKKNIYDVGSGKGIKIDEYVESLEIDVPLKEGDECEVKSNVADITDMKNLGWNYEIDLCKNWREIYQLAR